MRPEYLGSLLGKIASNEKSKISHLDIALDIYSGSGGVFGKLSKCPQISYFKTDLNGITPEDMKLIDTMIRDNTSLTALDLCLDASDISDQSFSELVDCLKKNTVLKKLVLSSARQDSGLQVGDGERVCRRQIKLGRCLLLLDILSDDRDGCAATTSSKITR